MAEFISREQALSMPFANGEYDHRNADPHFINGCETYKEWLEQLPVADVVERRTGVWEERDFGDDIYYPVCSECEYVPKLLETTNFCPNCGADMRLNNG